MITLNIISILIALLLITFLLRLLIDGTLTREDKQSILKYVIYCEVDDVLKGHPRRIVHYEDCWETRGKLGTTFLVEVS